jgi:glycosyltransferase involved in cell wall biosynthesis
MSRWWYPSSVLGPAPAVAAALELPVVSSPLRVTVLNWRDTSHPEGGGSERYVERVAAGLAADGCAVLVRCARHPGSAVRERRGGFELRRAGGRLTVYPRALAGLVADRLRGRGPDVVLDVQNGVPFFARLVAGCPVLVLVHHVHREQWGVALGPVMARLGWWLESQVAPRVLRGCQYVTVSEVTRGELTGLGVDPGHVAVVRNGADAVPEVQARRSPSPRLVVLGRLVPHKRVEHALEVLARLLPEFPDLRLDVVGDGWWHDRLVGATRARGLEHAVAFHGYLPEEVKHEVLAQAWVQLAPSLKEGWGLMVVEAAQHRVPTVAYRAAGGLAESVRDGVTGVLVDDLDGLTEATRTLLVDAARRASLGTAAQAHAGNFTWRAATTRMLGLLRRAASGAPPVAIAADDRPGAALVPPAQRAGAEPGGLAPDPLAP